MRRALVVILCALAASTCGPPGSDACCVPVRAARATAYSGTIAGTGTVVRIEVAGNGNTAITFSRDGHEIAAGYAGALITP